MPTLDAETYRKREATERRRAALATTSWAAGLHIRTAEFYAERVRKIEHPDG